MAGRARAVSSAEEQPAYNRQVTGSNPVPPTEIVFAPGLVPQPRPATSGTAMIAQARGHPAAVVRAVVSGLFICPSDHDQRQRSLRSTVVTERAGSASPAGSGSAPIAEYAHKIISSPQRAGIHRSPISARRVNGLDASGGTIVHAHGAGKGAVGKAAPGEPESIYSTSLRSLFRTLQPMWPEGSLRAASRRCEFGVARATPNSHPSRSRARRRRVKEGARRPAGDKPGGTRPVTGKSRNQHLNKPLRQVNRVQQRD